MVTIADVAKRAGVSIATVSRVLSPGAAPHPVSPATAQRVRTAAGELKFVPSEVARGLVARRSGLLGLIVPDLTDPHYPQIAKGVEETARRAELAVLICNTLGNPEDLADYLRVLRARRVEAIVLSRGSGLGGDELGRLTAIDRPVVLIGRPMVPVELPHVSIDNVGAARAATQHLIDIGRCRIAHLPGPMSQRTMQDRSAGYSQAIAAAGLEPWFGSAAADPEEGYAAALQLLRLPADRRPDALFAATDRLAIAAVAAAYDRGLRVPEDLAVIGFDDVPMGRYLRPSLSSVAQPAEQLGQTAVELAQQLLAGHAAHSVELAARVIPRASTGAAQA